MVRCFLSNAAGKRNHRWPLKSRISLNGRPATHVQQPQSWDGVSSKDKNEDEPLVLPFQSLRPGCNELSITSCDPVPHVCVALVVEERSFDHLRQAIEAQELSWSSALSHVRSIFGDQPEDDELSAGAARLSLQCPLSHTRLVNPVRSRKCKHLECFDLVAYLRMAQASRFPRYQCPRCGAHARPHELILDPWMRKLLSEIPENCLEAEVEPDGSFKVSAAGV